MPKVKAHASSPPRTTGNASARQIFVAAAFLYRDQLLTMIEEQLDHPGVNRVHFMLAHLGADRILYGEVRAAYETGSPSEWLKLEREMFPTTGAISPLFKHDRVVDSSFDEDEAMRWWERHVKDS